MNNEENAYPKIALVVTYFGPFKSDFVFWCRSAQANPEFDFLIFTDHLEQGMAVAAGAPNIHFFDLDSPTFVVLAQKALSFPCLLPNPYKLCDYKPAYGLIYAEELKGYDYWGYCDLDLIFGRLTHFLKPETFGNVDRYYSKGHFCLYANRLDVNRRFLLPLPSSHVHFQKLMKKPKKDLLSARDCYSSKAEWGFDEIFVERLWQEKNFSQFSSPSDFMDVNEFHYRFRACADSRFGQKPLYFVWNNGILQAFVAQNQSSPQELMYAHFQKKKLAGSLPRSSWLIVPNEVLEEEGLTRKQKSHLARRLKPFFMGHQLSRDFQARCRNRKNF
jgi:hypothetical protein